MPGSTDAVDVVATRRVSFEDRKLVRYVYRDGEMKFKSVFFATAADGPWLEEMAAKLDQAVRKAY